MQPIELPKTYNPQGLEEKWYQIWLDNKSFKAKPNKNKKPFSIIMPPPNVTGRLHMGHALDNTCQDILVRFYRMKGHDTLWIPGTDHAGIATQSVVEKQLYKDQKKSRHDLGREEFMKLIWAWKKKNENEIKDQLKKIGVSCDWDYDTFTMDEIPNKAVKKFFVTLYNQGLIYQANYIVNWDPVLQSAISDAEVEHKEVKGFFYHVLYRIENSDETIEIATTRPETIFADTAVAVHPDDERYQHLIGKKVMIPMCDRSVTIIADDYVDQDKGTGCLKVTPGHDFNDFEIGKRHQLPILNILSTDGRFNNLAPDIEGMKVKEARLKVEQILTEIGALKDKKEHIHQVAHGERSDSIVEPRVSKQWFVNVSKMAETAVKAVENNEMTFFPKGWENTYYSWLKEPKDWCISRQLWWGHQIPVYNCDSCHHQWASEESPLHCPECRHEKISQDPDVLDTWFSSGLWPLSTLGWPDEKAMKEKGFDKYYPNSVLVTGFDIIFFWVARMMMMSMAVTSKAPFPHVYIHAIVRDKQGKKMSKSLGNGIDPIEMIEKFGADAMRFTLAAGSGYNRNLNLDPERVESYRNFINKLWNAFRFIHPHLGQAKDDLPSAKELHEHDRWILAELNLVVKDMNSSIVEYRFDDACSSIYQFVYEKFCSWYIEFSKSILYGKNEREKQIRVSVLKYCFKKIVILLHPVIPFITEEIWNYLETKSLLINEPFIEYNPHFEAPELQLQMNEFIEVVTTIRNLRQTANLKPKDEVDIRIFTNSHDLAGFLFKSRWYLKDLAGVKSGRILSKNHSRPSKSISNALTHSEIFLPLEGLVDIQEHVKKVEKEREKTKIEKDKVEAKLTNDNFMSHAPPEVVAEVHAKSKGLEEKIKSLNLILEQLN
jgi:valyl-tRNA synthetase